MQAHWPVFGGRASNSSGNAEFVPGRDVAAARCMQMNEGPPQFPTCVGPSIQDEGAMFRELRDRNLDPLKRATTRMVGLCGVAKKLPAAEFS